MVALAGLAPKIAVLLVAMMLGGSAAFVGASALNRPSLSPTAREAPDYLLSGAGDAIPAAFDLLEAERQPTLIPGLAPADLALASATLIDAQPVAGLRPLGFPRVEPVSQFDGGPFAHANCTLAAGAMLARLGFGIVTTGSILRTLQDDQVGGTGLDDLATALFRGYGVTINLGSITPSQLRSLLTAGYGVVVQGRYAEIPGPLRLQPSFAGPHAVYLDGFYAGDGTTPPAYYVIDPLGHGGSYRGHWWPASIVDAFTLDFGFSGRIAAAWIFPPAGTPPEVVGPDVLPLPPSGGDGPPGPGETASPTLEPGATLTPEVSEPGDLSPADPPVLGDPPIIGDVAVGGLDIRPILEICLLEPRPPGCPGGIEGIFTLPFPFLEFALGPSIDIVAVDSAQPNIVFVAFTVSPATPVDVRFWEADGTPATIGSATAMQSLPLPGGPTIVARLDVLAATAYHFQVVAGDGLFSSSSPVGTFTTGGGVSVFDVALDSASDPVFEFGVGLSPYVHLAGGSLAFPLVRTTGASTPSGCAIIDYGGDSFCRFIEPTVEVECTQAQVSYALNGIAATGVYVRAFPTEDGETSDGSPSLAGVLETEGPSGTGDVSIGCLASGLSYTIALDAIGDDRGVLISRTLDVP